MEISVPQRKHFWQNSLSYHQNILHLLSTWLQEKELGTALMNNVFHATFSKILNEQQ